MSLASIITLTHPKVVLVICGRWGPNPQPQDDRDLTFTKSFSLQSELLGRTLSQQTLHKTGKLFCNGRPIYLVNVTGS